MHAVFDFKDMLLCALATGFWMDPPCIDLRAHQVQPKGYLSGHEVQPYPNCNPSCSQRRDPLPKHLPPHPTPIGAPQATPHHTLVFPTRPTHPLQPHTARHTTESQPVEQQVSVQAIRRRSPGIPSPSTRGSCICQVALH